MKQLKRHPKLYTSVLTLVFTVPFLLKSLHFIVVSHNHLHHNKPFKTLTVSQADDTFCAFQNDVFTHLISHNTQNFQCVIDRIETAVLQVQTVFIAPFANDFYLRAPPVLS